MRDPRHLRCTEERLVATIVTTMRYYGLNPTVLEDQVAEILHEVRGAIAQISYDRSTIGRLGGKQKALNRARAKAGSRVRAQDASEE